MRVCVTGATGFLGRALVAALHRDGHAVSAWVRSEDQARRILGADVELASDRSGPSTLEALVARSEAVVNLAGEPILGKRWSAQRRAALHHSRVGLTGRVVQAIERAATRPSVLISGSAVGYYGDRGDERLTEQSSPGADFLADLSLQWEAAALRAEGVGVRVATIRTGVVLGRAGGALAQMLPPFRFGVGGPIGSGRQFMPWIHLNDFVRIVTTALVDDRYRGATNGVTDAVTNRDFTRALGRTLHRPAVLPMPALVLRAIFGDAAAVLLGSQRIEPHALRERGFLFAFPALDAALADAAGR